MNLGAQEDRERVELLVDSIYGKAKGRQHEVSIDQERDGFHVRVWDPKGASVVHETVSPTNATRSLRMMVDVLKAGGGHG